MRVTFHLTDRCRNECKFCFVRPNRDPRELPARIWSDAATALATLFPGVEIVLTGGEPLLFDGVDAIVRAAARAGAIVHFNSSGDGLGPEQARELAQAGVRHVNLSLDGPPPLHDFLRGRPGAYRRANEALDNLVGNAPGVRRNIVTVVMGANLPGLADFADALFADDRVDGVYFQILANPAGVDGGDAWLADPDLFHPDAELRRRLMRHLQERQAQGAKINNPAAALAMQAAVLADPSRVVEGSCPIEEFGFCVDARGDVSLCGLFAPLGNIAREPLATILADERRAPTIRRMRECRRPCHRRVNCASAAL